MSAERITHLDSSAIVKLVEVAPESAALRTSLRRRRPYVSSALARAEVTRALLPRGLEAVRRGQEVLSRIDLLRINDRVLNLAGELQPNSLRTLDAIHLASARLFGASLGRIVTYDQRMAGAARSLGCAWPPRRKKVEHAVAATRAS
jgi:predicted nucleic acid-binding protein